MSGGAGMSDDRWLAFFDATADRDEPREMLVEALRHAPTVGLAVDLGCGCGHDALAMARHGLDVVAVDAHPEATRRTREAAQRAGLDDRIRTVTAPFESLVDRPEFKGPFDLVHAGFSLPFCDPEAFPDFWSAVRARLKERGIISGQFFGPRDQWANESGHMARTFLSERQVDECLAGLERLHFEEVERDGTTATGNAKHWHVFHFVVRKGV